MSKRGVSYFKALSIYWPLGGIQLKLGGGPDHCCCFAEGKYLAWCDVALGGQLRDLGRCHFGLRLHSHMTSVVLDGNAQVDVTVWKKFHVTFMQQLTNVWSTGMHEICAVTDRRSLWSAAHWNLSVKTTVNNVNRFVNRALRSPLESIHHDIFLVCGFHSCTFNRSLLGGAINHGIDSKYSNSTYYTYY